MGEEPGTSRENLITNRKIIKKIVMINGVPTEKEEIEDPESIPQNIDIGKRVKKIVMINGVPTETEEIVKPDMIETTNITKRRIIRKIVMINGVPTETEELVDEPASMEESMISER